MINNSKSYQEPGVYVTDVSKGLHSIVGVHTSRTAFIGLAKKGPVTNLLKLLIFYILKEFLVRYIKNII